MALWPEEKEERRRKRIEALYDFFCFSLMFGILFTICALIILNAF